MMTSAKKEIFLQLQQMHKQEHSTFEFEIEFFLEKTQYNCIYQILFFYLRRNLFAKGGGVCQGLTSLLRRGVQCLTNADKGGRGVKKVQKYADVICEWPRIQKTITLGWSLKLTQQINFNVFSKKNSNIFTFKISISKPVFNDSEPDFLSNIFSGFRITKITYSIVFSWA